MARRRFYAPPADISGSTIRLPADETHHLARVLRLATGDEVFVFDGVGNEYRCSVTSSRGARAELEVIEPIADIVESPVQLTLAQALSKGDKFDFIVQKATELGVSRIVPLATDHADVKLSADQGIRRVDRWRRVSLEALKQCGRRRLVEICPPIPINALIEDNDTDRSGLFVVFSEKGGVALDAELKEAAVKLDVTVVIGPEGGWSAAELNLLGDRGARAVSLGPRTLRTETAAVVAVALLQHLLGDLSKGDSEIQDRQNL